jgi:asparagine synthase (glutamine-hydrolysing)
VAIELIEIDASSALPFDYSNKKQPLNPNKPSHELVNSKWHELISAYIPSNESSIIIGGQGSDHIFMCPPTKKSLTDYILEKGLKGAGAKLQNITHLYRDSLFSVLAENAISLGSYVFAYRRKKRHPKNILDRAPPLIKEIIDIKITSDFHHPIYERLPSRILPGKYAQIDALYEGLASIQVEMNPINPTFNPFLCHPMIEFALSIPTYELFDKGYDRYPLRKSISERFHTETVWRRDKGETTGVFQLGVKKNLDYVLDLCLDGVLIKQNIIDKKELRKTILLISNGDINYLWPFTYLSAIEIFIKQWNEKKF